MRRKCTCVWTHMRVENESNEHVNKGIEALHSFLIVTNPRQDQILELGFKVQGQLKQLIICPMHLTDRSSSEHRWKALRRASQDKKNEIKYTGLVFFPEKVNTQKTAVVITTKLFIMATVICWNSYLLIILFPDS